MKTLRLHEEILLLALQDESGTLHSGTSWPYAVAGAVLAELLLEDRLRLEERKGRQHVVLAAGSLLGDPVSDRVLERITHAKKSADLTTWVGRVAGMKDLKHDIAEQLTLQGVLKMETHRVLLIFSHRVYPEIDPAPELEIMHRIEHAIFSDDPDVDARTAILISLAHAGGILDPVFGKQRVSERQDRLEQIAEDRPTAEAARAAIEAARAAMVAIMAATAATTTTTR